MLSLKRRTAQVVLTMFAFLFISSFLPPLEQARAESWEQINRDGFGDVKNYNAFSMLVYYEELYVGTQNQTGASQVWKYDEKSWKKVDIGPFTPYGTIFASYAVFNDKVYIGTYNAPTGCKVLCYDGVNVYQVNEDGFGNPNNTGATSMAEYNGYLYVGTSQPSYGSGLEIWRTKGEGGPPFTDWEKVGSSGLGDRTNTAALSMAVYGNLYVGTYNKIKGAQVWRYDEKRWKKASTDGFGDKKTVGASSMCVLAQYLYTGTERTSGGLRIWRYDGSSWERASRDGFGDVNNKAASSMTIYNGKLYVGTKNEKTGCEVWRTGGPPVPPPPPPQFPTSFYFAEGYTGPGFQEYLCLGNANEREATVAVTYMFNDGTGIDAFYTIPPLSRTTIDVNAAVGPNREVSIRVLSNEKNIVAERPMYFNYLGVWTGGHNCVGAVSPGYKWYFAEGTTIEGFDEYITVQNPGAFEAHLKLRFMIEGTGEVVFNEAVRPETRATFSAERYVGADKHVSLLIESDQYIVAERPMYFNYGPGRNNWTGGHCIVGLASPEKTWYFAEGTTREGFESWLCIQNPEPVTASVSARYMFADGQGEPVEKTYTVAPLQRLTVFVNEEVGPEKDVSIKLTSDTPIVAERPMYFLYHGAWDGGHDGAPVKSPEKTWFFAEGYTGSNFDEWLCIQNPSSDPTSLEIVYFPSNGVPVRREHTVAGRSRKTIYVNEDAGRGLELSALVSSRLPVICERPMYFNYGGITGGHVVPGFVPSR